MLVTTCGQVDGGNGEERGRRARTVEEAAEAEEHHLRGAVAVVGGRRIGREERDDGRVYAGLNNGMNGAPLSLEGRRGLTRSFARSLMD